MKTIILTKGFEAKIDDEDVERISRYNWHASKKGSYNGKIFYYAMRSKRYFDGTKKGIYLHREVMSAIPGQEVDHIDGDPFNNQKSNLRVCSHSENMANRIIHHRVKSKFRGIYKVGNKWAAKCYKKYLGVFCSDIEAAKAFDLAAIERFGEFANLNFPNIHGLPESGSRM